MQTAQRPGTTTSRTNPRRARRVIPQMRTRMTRVAETPTGINMLCNSAQPSLHGLTCPIRLAMMPWSHHSKQRQLFRKGGRLLVIYDSKNAGESKTHPKLRTPPLKTTTMHRLVRAVLQARMGPATNAEGKFEVGAQDDFLFFDGKKSCA